jgi:hypothetical protein
VAVKKRKKVRKGHGKGESVAHHDQDIGVEMVEVNGKWVPQDHAVWDNEKQKWSLPLPAPAGTVRLRGWEKSAANRDRPLCPICGTTAPGAMCLSVWWGVPVHESCVAAWSDGLKVPTCALCGNAKLLPMVLDAEGRAVHKRCLESRALKTPTKEYETPSVEVKGGSEKVKRRKRRGKGETEKWYDGIRGKVKRRRSSGV